MRGKDRPEGFLRQLPGSADHRGNVGNCQNVETVEERDAGAQCDNADNQLANRRPVDDVDGVDLPSTRGDHAPLPGELVCPRIAPSAISALSGAMRLRKICVTGRFCTPGDLSCSRYVRVAKRYATLFGWTLDFAQ